jgi:hypothetical protein
VFWTKGGEAVSEKITLPRDVVEQMRGELYALVRHADGDCGELDCEECEPIRPIRAAVAALDAALADASREGEQK